MRSVSGTPAPEQLRSRSSGLSWVSRQRSCNCGASHLGRSPFRLTDEKGKCNFLFEYQSPAPGFGEKYWNLSGLPSHSLESGGGAFFTVMFGQIFAYCAFSNSHFSSPGSVSGLI